jgi:hypothetical protein
MVSSLNEAKLEKYHVVCPLFGIVLPAESNSVRSMINASEIASKHLARIAEVG